MKKKGKNIEKLEQIMAVLHFSWHISIVINITRTRTRRNDTITTSRRVPWRGQVHVAPLL